MEQQQWRLLRKKRNIRAKNRPTLVLLPNPSLLVTLHFWYCYLHMGVTQFFKKLEKLRYVCPKSIVRMGGIGTHVYLIFGVGTTCIHLLSFVTYSPLVESQGHRPLYFPLLLDPPLVSQIGLLFVFVYNFIILKNLNATLNILFLMK